MPFILKPYKRQTAKGRKLTIITDRQADRQAGRQACRETDDKILVSKETVVLYWWESETRKVDFIKRVDKGQVTTVKDFEKLTFQALVLRQSDKGLMLEKHLLSQW